MTSLDIAELNDLGPISVHLLHWLCSLLHSLPRAIRWKGSAPSDRPSSPVHGGDAPRNRHRRWQIRQQRMKAEKVKRP